MRYTVHPDGTFDITGTHISITGCYPAINGIPLHPVKVTAERSSAIYDLMNGKVEIRMSKDGEGRVAIESRVQGRPGIHAFSPVFMARPDGAEKAFVQGPGMEGPSGVFPLQKAGDASFGLTALFTGRNALLAYAEDHRRFRLLFRSGTDALTGGGGACFSGTFILEGTTGADTLLPTVFVEETSGLEEGLAHAAGRIAAAMHARQNQPPAFFWSSWYHAYETMDREMLAETLAGIRSAGTPFQYIELDAGYTPSLGDWLTPNHRWPGGLSSAARAIKEAGFGAGIWIGPFIVGNLSALYRTHPDWILREKDGSPVIQLTSYTEPKMWGNPDTEYYVLDASHPDALAYLSDVFRTLHQWGFTFFKTDFMLWSMHDTDEVRRFDPSLTSVEIMRNVLKTIREAIGEESYLLGCIAPFMPFIGYADGMRIASDCGARWAEAFGPLNLIRELPCDNYFNHIFWQNDPDAMMLRDFDTMLTEEEVFTLVLFQAFSGGAVSTSDPVARLSDDRKDLLRFVEPDGKKRAVRLPFIEKDAGCLVMTHRTDRGNILFIMNPAPVPVPVLLCLKELFGNREWYQYRYSRTGESDRSIQDPVFCDMIPAHGSALLYITEEPLSCRPENLWHWQTARSC